MNRLFQWVREWVDNALNWLYHFTRKVLGWIRDLFEALRDMIDDWLDDSDEVIVIDPNEGNKGEELWKIINEAQPNKVTWPDLVAMNAKSQEIEDMTSINANPEQRGKLEKALAANDGLLRISK